MSKINYRIKMLKTLQPFSYGVNRFLLLNALAGLIMMGLNFILPLFYKIFIDDVILGQQFSLMPVVISGYIAVFTATMLMKYAKNYFTNRWVNRVTFRAKMKIIAGFFSRDFSEYDSQSVGDMKMRLEDDSACINDYAEKQTTDYVKAYLTMIIAVVLLFLIEWRLAVFSCFGIPFTLWLDHQIAKREAVLNNENRENDQGMSSWLHASIQGWREVKALNLQKHEERKFVHFIHKFAIYFGTWINYWVMRALIIPKIKDEFAMRFCLYFIGGLLIMKRDFEIGSLLVFMQYYALLAEALETVSNADAELLSAKPQTERLLSELAHRIPNQCANYLSEFPSAALSSVAVATATTPSSALQTENSSSIIMHKDLEYGVLEKVVTKKSGKTLPDGNGSIIFEKVSFAYPGSLEMVMENLSFEIKKGERVAITGRSGAGKTTVLKLMLNMLSPSSGEIRLSDVPVGDIRPEVLYQYFGFVMQENTLFNASVRENLLYAKSKANELELEEACRKAYIWDFIQTLPEGLGTIIGERGIKLSGGQKQRIVLARLFLRNVEVLIFDEATSALDQYSESFVHDAIAGIGADKTVIIVAHRKSSLKLCDRVVVL